MLYTVVVTTSPVDYMKQFPVRYFEKGATIISEGNQVPDIYAVAQGFISVSAMNENGSQQLLWIAGRYDIVPAELLFSKSAPSGFFYTALSDVTAYSVPKQDFLQHANEDIVFMSEIARGMSMHYDDLLYRLRSVEQTKAQHKIALTLLNLGKRFSAESIVNLYELGLELTHQDIADMVGMTRETTSLELGKLRKERYLTYNRGKLILFMEKLAVFNQ